MQVQRKLSFLFVCFVGLLDKLKLQSQLVLRTLQTGKNLKAYRLNRERTESLKRF